MSLADLIHSAPFPADLHHPTGLSQFSSDFSFFRRIFPQTGSFIQDSSFHCLFVIRRQTDGLLSLFQVCQSHTLQKEKNFSIQFKPLNFWQAFGSYLCWPAGLSGMTRFCFPLRLCFFISDWSQIRPGSVEEAEGKRVNAVNVKWYSWNEILLFKTALGLWMWNQSKHQMY